MLAPLTSPGPQPARFQGDWVGGIELGGDFVPFALHIETSEPGALATSARRLDVGLPAFPMTSTQLEEASEGEEELRIGFDRGGITWSFRLTSWGEALSGEFVSRRGSFEASFVRMSPLEAPELERFTGVFQREDGARLRLDAEPAGFLRACFPDEGRFQYLFPQGGTTFFAGPDFERPLPKVLEVTFLDDESGLRWAADGAEPWRAHRIVPEPLALTLEASAIVGPGLSMPLVRVEPGEFEMGQHHPSPEILARLGITPDGPPPAVDPLRRTSITRPFLLASVEVTRAWFEAFVRETGHMTDAERLGTGLVWDGEHMRQDPSASWRAPQVECAPDAPVVMVSWNDAHAFCAWMSRALGRTVRLPTEAEWEYACRAGTESMFSWGDDLGALDEHVWGHSNAHGPRPVGGLRPNAWGLHDMHGNVWEWCADLFGPISAEPAVDPRGPREGSSRVMRGGSWINGPWLQRSEFRAGENAGLAEPHVGFRVAVEAEPLAAEDSELEARIRRIEDGLLPGLRVRGRTTGMKLGERMSHYDVPGLSVAVIEDGRIDWARGYGFTDRDGGQAVDAHTPFLAGSISKPVTALAALRLVDEGVLALDEDVNRWLETWKVPESELTRTEKVTLRRLLSHGAGLTVHGFPGYAVSAPLPTLAQVLDGLAPANTAPIRVDAVPGTLWRYSGGGYTVLQQLLVDVTKKPFPELMHALVLEPAGMLESRFGPLSADLEAVAASGHRQGSAVVGRWHVYPEMAAAGLWTTASDLARYVLEVQRALEGRSQVLSRATAEEMVSVQKGDYGLGPSLSHAGEATARFEHGGVDEGYEAFFSAYCREGRGAVVMTNANGAMPLTQELLRAIAHEYGWPDYLPAEHTLVRLEPRVLEGLAGRYALATGDVLRVTAREGRLLAQGDGPAFELLPESRDSFVSPSGMVHRFERGPDDRGLALVLEDDGHERRAERVRD